MALGDIPGAIGTAFEALGTRSAAASSDYRDDLETIDAGETKYQIRTVVAGRNTTNSNDTRSNMTVELICAHALTPVSGVYDERTYTRGQMLTDTRSVLDPNWWRSIAGILAVSEADIEVERIGRVIQYTVTATLEIAF